MFSVALGCSVEAHQLHALVGGAQEPTITLEAENKREANPPREDGSQTHRANGYLLPFLYAVRGPQAIREVA